jgi:hypothetical protein
MKTNPLFQYRHDIPEERPKQPIEGDTEKMTAFLYLE